MLELIESIDDYERRERRLFRWTCGWFVALASLPGVYILHAFVIGRWALTHGEIHPGLGDKKTISMLLTLAGLVCLVCFPFAMFAWIGAARRHRRCYKMLGQPPPLSMNWERRPFYWACGWAGLASLAAGSYFTLLWREENELGKAISSRIGPVELHAIVERYVAWLLVSRLTVFVAIVMTTVLLIRWVVGMRRNRQQWPSFTEGS